MKKKILLRGLLGFPLGLAIGYTITILISLFVAGGYYSPCAPALVDMIGSVIGAVIFQAILFGLLGAVFGAASVIWEFDKWSIVKKTGIYFLVTASTMFLFGWCAHWLVHSISGFLLYAGIFVVIFVCAWIIQYYSWKKKIKTINTKTSEQQ